MLRRAVLLLAAVSSFAWAAHNPLLPRPVKVRYGDGALPVAQLSVRFANAANEEDRFVQKWLVERLKLAPGGAKALTMRRTGNGAPLPGLDEKTGPDSREAYSIKITSAGAGARDFNRIGFA